MKKYLTENGFFEIKEIWGNGNNKEKTWTFKELEKEYQDLIKDGWGSNRIDGLLNYLKKKEEN